MTTIDSSNDVLLRELTPVVGNLVERHLATTKEWFPHELVPWSRGRDFEPGEQWDAEAWPLPEAVSAALVVNLLTEDNLPYYFRTIERVFGPEGPWGEWVRRWTAEEGRHSIAIRDYLTVTRAVDPIALERDRMHQVGTGIVPEPPSPADGLVYVALQELATRISHRATGKLLDDPAGYQVMARVAADENLHFLFYRDLVTAGIEIDPSTMVIAMERQVRDFEMPGTGIPNFGDRAMAIAKAGIYDMQIHHDQILLPVVLRDWNVAEITGLNPQAEEARTTMLKRIERIGKAGRRMAERWAESARRHEPVSAAG
ncbi:MAG: acyl-[acyl-carrier-protein] desaturase [Actinomycetota bacterium]|jgi:acyl-[acyl-carrier-protein] desaturase|nr:acyl-[acyl-carrier-protein] desaturase [Actinomycetota bacterium]